MKREEVKEKIKKYIEEHGEPIGGYYYDDCHLVLEYSDSETGLNILSDETFKYWEDNALIGKYVLKEEYEKLLKEIGVDCIVLPYEYGYDEDSLDFIENQLEEFCFGIPELETKFEKMSNAEKVQWYNELNNDEDNDTLLDNEKIIEKILWCPENLESKYEKFKNNKEFMSELLKYNGYILGYASDELQNDKEVVLEAVKQDGSALKYASRELKSNKKFILEAVKKYGYALEYASKELQSDKEVVLEAVKQNGYALKYASKELQNDKEVVLEAVKKYGDALDYASKELQNDKEIVLEARKRKW